MNSIERVRRALQLKEPDRVPIITFTHIANRNLSPEMTRYIRNNADAQYEFCADEFSYLSFPGVGTECARTETKDAHGWITRTYACGKGTSFAETFRFSEEGVYRSYRKHLFNTPADVQALLKLPYVEPRNNRRFNEQIRHFFEAAAARNTANAFCLFTINNPLSFLCANTDPVLLAVWTLEERSLLVEYIEDILKKQLDYLDYALKRYDVPAVFMIGGAEFAIPPLMSPKDFDSFVFEPDRRIIERIKRYDKQVIVHCHGKIHDFIPRFIEMGADGIHPLEPVGPTGDCDLGMVKAKYGNRICLVGNIQYEDFAESTPLEMEAKVKEVINCAKEGGGFILSPACPLFHGHMPEKIERNIKAFIDAGLAYGRYGQGQDQSAHR